MPQICPLDSSFLWPPPVEAELVGVTVPLALHGPVVQVTLGQTGPWQEHAQHVCVVPPPPPAAESSVPLGPAPLTEPRPPKPIPPADWPPSVSELELAFVITVQGAEAGHAGIDGHGVCTHAPQGGQGSSQYCTCACAPAPMSKAPTSAASKSEAQAPIGPRTEAGERRARERRAVVGGSRGVGKLLQPAAGQIECAAGGDRGSAFMPRMLPLFFEKNPTLFICDK